MTDQTGRYLSKAHEGTILRDRFTSEDIFERIIQVASEEVTTKTRELFFSGLAAGFAITLTFFLYASMTGKAGGHALLGAVFYPLGFVYIILGNYQLFTENTLPPVALVLERMASVPSMLRVWGVVLAGNLLGGALGALVLAKTGVFTPQAAQAAMSLSQSALSVEWADLFVKACFAGFIVAGVVWLDYAARDTATRFFLVYTAFLTIPLTGLYHVVVTATEAFYLFFVSGASLLGTLGGFVLPVLLGNIVGGVVLVTIVNYFQTPAYLREDSAHKLSWRDWLVSMKVVRARGQDE